LEKDKNNNHKISTFEIQLGEQGEHESNHKDLLSSNRVVKSKECCLTCGGNKRLQWIERVDGKRVVKEACLFCITKIHTAANRRSH
jgi:hypothetical protein